MPYKNKDVLHAYQKYYREVKKSRANKMFIRVKWNYLKLMEKQV